LLLAGLWQERCCLNFVGYRHRGYLLTSFRSHHSLLPLPTKHGKLGSYSTFWSSFSRRLLGVLLHVASRFLELLGLLSEIDFDLVFVFIEGDLMSLEELDVLPEEGGRHLLLVGYEVCVGFFQQALVLADARLLYQEFDIKIATEGLLRNRLFILFRIIIQVQYFCIPLALLGL